MGWKVQGEPLKTSNTDGTIFQAVAFNDTFSLVAARAWFVFYGDPAFTGISLGMFSTRNGVPQKLIATSDMRTKEEIIAAANGVKEIYFRFDDVAVNESIEYAFAPILSGYTYAEGSHIAWKSSYPDPVYRTGLTLERRKKLVYPFDLYFIGG